MIRMIQRRLIIPRGDTGSFSIPYLKTINAGDVAVFTIFDIRTKTKMYQKLIAAEGDILNIAFSHSDTVNLKPGKYLWDIKFYTNPQFVDDELINGDEIDSYYAGFTLPECEIRETGDTLLTSDDAPTNTISPESLNIINAAINEALNSKRVAVEAAETASSKADAATESAENASNSASAANQSAALAEMRVNEIENLSVEVDTGLEGTDASVTYAPFTGVLSFMIPRGNTGNGIASCVLNDDFTLTINYTNGDSTTTIPIRGDTPHLTIGEVTEGPQAIATITGTDANPILNLTLPNANVPTKLSQLIDNIGIAKSGDLAAVATSGSYTDLEDKPYIPVKTSDLTNDVGYLTEHQDISGKADKSEIPTKVSQLQNDSGYLTSFTETDPTVPAWAKTATKPSYTAAEIGAPTVAEMNTAIGEAIGQINSFDMAIAQTLPTEDISTHTIYLVPKTGETNDVYDEYVYINSKWEMVGNTQIDLSDYALKSELPIKVSELSNDSGYLTSYTETDPTVPQWAKANTKPSYTAAEVGALPSNTHIPTTTAELTNDAGFITSAVVPTKISDLTDDSGHYIKPETGIPASDLEEEIVSTIDGKAPAIWEDVNGSIVHFEDGAENMSLRKCVVGIEPVQDLHGYDSPWPAGGGVNLLDAENDLIVYGSSTYGLTCTLTNRGFRLSGTTGDSESFTPGRKQWRVVLVRRIDLDGLFVAGFVSGSYNGKVIGFRFDINTNTIVIDIQNVLNNETYDFTVDLVIYSGPTAPTEWSPYSNICPITGWTGAKVQRTGKNLIGTSDITDYSKWSFNIAPSGNMPSSSSNRIYSLPALKSGVQYTISFGVTSASFPGYLYFGYYKDGSATRIAYVTTNEVENQSITFTAIEGVTYCLRMGGMSTEAMFNGRITKLSYIQLELSSSVTAYKPYQGETYDIAFPSEAGTVYGGTLDVTNGVLTVDRAMKVFSGDSSEGWYKSVEYGYFTTSRINDAINRNANPSDFQSNSFAFDTIVNNSSILGACLIWGYVRVRIADMSISLDEWKAQLASTPMQVVYTLATPQTYHLTPQEITTLLGTNNIWADTGDTAVTYKADTKLYIDKKFAELQALILEH